MDYTNHEHEGEWLPPLTIGGTYTRTCTVCGLYETKDSEVVIPSRWTDWRFWYGQISSKTKNTESL